MLIDYLTAAVSRGGWRANTYIVLCCCVLISAVASETRAQSLVYEGSEGIGQGKHIVFFANDHEYRSEQTCPLMAKLLAKHHGFKCTVLFGVDEAGHIKAGSNDVPGTAVLQSADLLFFFTRFMNLPDDQVDNLVAYFERGGPVVGLRTSTHCFNGQQGKWAKLNYNYEGQDYHGGLGEQVFGNTWHQERGQSHYGTNHQMGSRLFAADEAQEHPILSGIQQIHAYSGAYKSQPPADATPLLQVQVLNTFEPSDDANNDKPTVNAGWTRNWYVAPSGARKDARVVYTSFGASEDLLSEAGRRFLLNACLWAGGWEEAISSNLDVSIVGGYAPTPYSSAALYYGGVEPLDLAGWDSTIMPASAELVGVNSAAMAARITSRVLPNRPALKAKLAGKYPELYGPDAKLPDESPRPRRGR
ncbi:MAG: ThuA domain-containing protein [Planctomycetales bacterium]|nr:ThuA domain-containing protein [Planctomycetales bacterium]